MFEMADAFVALPGGIGTLEELVEQLTWAQLGRHRKPVLVANIEGFWEPLCALLDHMRALKFIRSDLSFDLLVADKVARHPADAVEGDRSGAGRSQADERGGRGAAVGRPAIIRCPVPILRLHDRHLQVFSRNDEAVIARAVESVQQIEHVSLQCGLPRVIERGEGAVHRSVIGLEHLKPVFGELVAEHEVLR